MVRLSKQSVFPKSFSGKKHVPFVVSKSIDTSHNIEIALQETKSLALLKSARKKPGSVIKTCLNELEDGYNSRKCSLTDLRQEKKQTSLSLRDELPNEYFYKEKKTAVCPFLTPLKFKKGEIPHFRNDEGMLPLQNYMNNDDLNIFSTIISPIAEDKFATANSDINHYFDLEEIWAEFMANLEEKALTTKLCSCILRKQNKLRTNLFEDDFPENTSIESSLVSVSVEDEYWRIKEIHKKALNEKRHTEIDQYEQTHDLLKNLSLNHSKSEQLRRCMCEIKQLRDSLKNKM